MVAKNFELITIHLLRVPFVIEEAVALRAAATHTHFSDKLKSACIC